MLISHPSNGLWYEVSGTTTAQIVEELGLDKGNWHFKINGTVRRSLGTIHEGDVIELVELVEDAETVQSEDVSKTSGDNK